MRLISLALALGTLTTGAAYGQDAIYQSVTGKLPGTELIAANIVRNPDFVGVSTERDRAILEAEPILTAEYCEDSGSQFAVSLELVIFDNVSKEWMVGGLCR